MSVEDEKLSFDYPFRVVDGALCGKLTTGQDIVVVHINEDNKKCVLEAIATQNNNDMPLALMQTILERYAEMPPFMFKKVGSVKDYTREDGILKRIWLEYDLLFDRVANELGGIGSRAGLKRVMIACETRFHYDEVKKPVAIHNTTVNRCTKQKPKKRRIVFRKKKAACKKAFKIKKAATTRVAIKKEPKAKA
jgi:hypothetical protein